jgi:hypothetical protein
MRNRIAGAIVGHVPVQALLERCICLSRCPLIGSAETKVTQLIAPRAFRSIDNRTMGLCEFRQRIALGRMEPAAAKIERYMLHDLGMGTPADPRHGFEQQHVPPAILQPPGRGNSGRTGTDNYDLWLHVLIPDPA